MVRQLVLTTAAMMLTACQLPSPPAIGAPGGKLEVSSQFDPTITRSVRFDHGIYNAENPHNLTAILWSGPADDPQEVLTIRIFIRPAAGTSAIDKTATNATMHLVVFGPNDQTPASAANATQVGVYSGSGFVFVHQPVASNRLQLSVWEANLRLTDRSAEFVDRAIGSNVTGKMIVLRADDRLPEQLHKVQVLLDRKLGYPRFVADEHLDAPIDRIGVSVSGN